MSVSAVEFHAGSAFRHRDREALDPDRTRDLEAISMLLQHVRAILLGPVTATILIPLVIVTIMGAAPVDLGAVLSYLALAVGVLLVAGGVAMLAWTVSLFAQQGKGTLSP